MKKTLFIVIPILAVAVTVGVLFAIGVLPPKGKKPVAAAEAEAEPAPVAAAPAVIETPAPRETPSPPRPTTDEEQGTRRLAAVWNEMDGAALRQVVADWNDRELVPVLLRMDDEKVTELLSGLEPKRASAVSRELQRQASLLR
jgi:hypothetical protein